MTFQVDDRVRDTATDTGTGNFTVSGLPPSTYQTFSNVCANNDTFPYCIQSQTANEWEVGVATYNTGNIIVRNAQFVENGSAGAGTLVNFSAGTKDVFITAPAANAYARTTLTNNTTYYVYSSGGSDSNNGTSASTPWATFAQALTVLSTIDGNGFQVTIATDAAGTHTDVAAFTRNYVGISTIILDLNGGTMSTSGSCITTAASTQIQRIQIQNGTLTSSGGSAIECSAPANILIGSSLTFGAVNTAGIYVHSNGVNVTVSNGYTVSGNMGWHILALSAAGLDLFCNQAITISGTPTLTNSWVELQGPNAGYFGGSSFVNPGNITTGKKYSASKNALIDTNGGGANFFPGLNAGTTATGGQYI